MKRLIVNADDFGLTAGVNRGILRAFQEGILTSTTIMANGEAFDDAVALARANPRLGVGCHLVLVGGNALTSRDEAPTLVDRNGQLPASLEKLLARLACGAVKPEHIERELRAQIERVRAEGIELTHLDSHKHTHIWPQVMQPLARVAEEFGIRRVRKPFEGLRGVLRLSRNGEGRAALSQRAKATAAQVAAPRFQRLVKTHGLRTPDNFFGIGLTGHLGAAAIVKILEALPEGTSELMCHPGLYDRGLERAPTRLKRAREAELEGLLAPAARQTIKERGIQLISYRELN
jgi:hopanoid biosynthesis associated protein HpnK